MENNTNKNRKPKGQHQKRVKKALLESIFNGYKAYHNIGETGYAHYSCGNILVYKGTNHSGKLIRVI
jgi:hypothetical protein